MTIVLKTDQENPDEQAIRKGAEIVRNGGTVVFPTETVYGLGANAFSSEACLKIFRAKGRPPDNPLIVHIASMAMIRDVADNVSGELVSKLRKIWPGPVTILFRKNSRIPDTVTGGSDLVAVRMPANRLALRLIAQSGVPIAAPSANISTRPSITEARHAMKELDGKVDLIYDSGPSPFGLESTIIDISGAEPVLLRAGAMPVEELRSIFGNITVTDFSRGLKESTIPLAPGMKYRHYSPDRNLFLATSREIVREISRSEDPPGGITIIASSEICEGSRVPCISLGGENSLDEVARRLFSSLRELEGRSGKAGIIMPFPETGRGLAIMNRIRKASSGTFSSRAELEHLIDLY